MPSTVGALIGNVFLILAELLRSANHTWHGRHSQLTLLYPVCAGILAAEDFLSLSFAVSLPSFQSLLCPPSSRKTSLTKVSHSLPISLASQPKSPRSLCSRIPGSPNTDQMRLHPKASGLRREGYPLPTGQELDGG